MIPISHSILMRLHHMLGLKSNLDETQRRMLINTAKVQNPYYHQQKIIWYKLCRLWTSAEIKIASSATPRHGGVKIRFDDDLTCYVNTHKHNGNRTEMTKTRREKLIVDMNKMATRWRECNSYLERMLDNHPELTQK